ncbi:type II secretion system protein [uncultured Legionella sp.]|uniref:type II secretion system protein n=1 Tax=uncultured Legionella sp. TaxID=210934 RepID=UPI00260E791E|nr:type II secretion system protein [uncultured Legionella sp.]
MKKECSGFVFLMTLCIILVISLLLFTVMHQVLLYGKAINRLEIHHQRFYQIEDTMKYLIQLKPDLIGENCIINAQSANKAITLLSRKEGCLLINNGVQYRYLIEKLGNFPCLVVHQNEQSKATHHTRITLLQNPDEIHPMSSVLQIRHIKMTNSLSCLGEEREVSSGISSWRYLADYQYLE